MKILFTSILLLLFLSTTVFISCEKNIVTPEKDTVIKKDTIPKIDTIPGLNTNKIVLSDIEVTATNSVKLKWTKLDTATFKEYLIVRKLKENEVIDLTNNNYYNLNIIKRISDPNIITFIDESAPITPFLEYQVIGVLSKQSGYENYVYSNNKSLVRNDIKFINVQLSDVLQDLNNNRLYTIESDSGRISIVNTVSGTIVKSIITNAKIGYCDLGTYNNTLELYVPRNDGWIYIYNAATLEKIDQISCGSPASSVVFNHNKLFVSTDDRSWKNLPTKILDRTSKALISTSGDWESTRLKLIPGSNTELIEITRLISPTELSFYKFDANGKKISHFSDTYHGDYPLNQNIFQVFPNGNEFITSNEGVIYGKDLVYKLRLPHGNIKYSDFAFNTTGSTIYAGCTNELAIISYSVPGYLEVNRYPTKGYPVKIFKKDNTIICLSLLKSSDLPNFPYSYSNGKLNLLIEKIQVN